MYNKFIAGEGIDGSGKGTQLAKIVNYLFDLDKKNTVVFTRNPYQSPKFGGEYEKIRGLLKDMSDPSEQANTLAELFINNRKDFSKEIVEKNKQLGHYIVCDRYDLSTLAYQGELQGLNINDLIKKHKGILIPGLTFIFDVPAETALQRTSKSSAHGEVFDSMKVEQTEKLRKAYLNLVNQFPFRKIVIIDGTKSVEEVFENVKKELEEYLKEIVRG